MVFSLRFFGKVFARGRRLGLATVVALAATMLGCATEESEIAKESIRDESLRGFVRQAREADRARSHQRTDITYKGLTDQGNEIEADLGAR
jgi:hypothetical protein